MARHVLLLAMIPLLIAGCDRQETYQGRPAAYWIQQSHSQDPQQQRQAMKALMLLTRDPDAQARSQTMLLKVTRQWNQNWQEVYGWLQDPAQTRLHTAEILRHLGNRPDQMDVDSFCNPIGFPVPERWKELRQLLQQRRDATAGDDRQLYVNLLDAMERH